MTGRIRQAAIGALIAGIGSLGLQQAHAATVLVSSNIDTSTTWTADNEYILTKVIYVTNGATLTIAPGTVIRGEGESTPGAHDPGTLVFTRGAKIRALGTQANPIVFTDEIDDNVRGSRGLPPYDNLLDAQSVTGQWGGLILLGRTYVANNTLSGPLASREFQIEGLDSDPNTGFGLYGNGGNDDDDSGTVRYVSIRYGGFNLSANNEINGLTVGGVGRQTDVSFVEVINTKDDGVEFFGGTVNVDHIAVINPGDDGFDYDEGFRGYGQYLFLVQGTPGPDKSDKGGENDGGNNPDGSQPFAIPTFYNVTMVGLGGQKAYTNSLMDTALHFRDNAGGRYYNSLFMDFGGATMLIEGGSGSGTSSNTSGERAITAYSVLDPNFHRGPASDFQLELQDNVFHCFGNGSAIPTGNGVPFGAAAADSGKLNYDNGAFTNAALENTYQTCGSTLPIKAQVRLTVSDPAIPDTLTTIDPRPAAGSPLLTTNRVPPANGFFTPAAFKGAFGPGTTDNWLAGWSTASRLGYFPKEVVNVNANITSSQLWTADKEYLLQRVVYVTNGSTLTIEPGTVIRGESESTPGAHDPGTLVITRGAKINAVGTVDKPIVFTDLLDDNYPGSPASFPYDSAPDAMSITGQWGGLILLGRTYVANNTLSGPLASREFQIEGLDSDPNTGFGLYGNGGNDDDDSGTVRYLSIRHGGFNLSANNEINGLTLGGVGRQTDVSFVEVIDTKDDGVEFFGGTVNVDHVAVINPGDDGYDYDEGFRGYGQYLLLVQGTPGPDKSDKGGENDGGNNPDGSQPFAVPTFYNTTFVGLGGQKAYTNSLMDTALHFRDNAGGRYYNSLFMDFGGATMLIEGGSGSATSSNTSGERAITAYAVLDPNFHRGPASDFQLELQDNVFHCFGNGSAIPTGNGVPFGAAAADSGKLNYDNGAFTNAALENTYQACGSTLPIQSKVRLTVSDPAIPDTLVELDPRPAAGGSLLTTNRLAPANGFFTSAPYKGAFSPNENWLAGWSAASRQKLFPGCDPITGPQAAPDEIKQIDVAGDAGNTISWSFPASLGCSVFDVLRATSATGFDSGAVCVETNDVDSVALEAAMPAPGTAYFYVVRAGNGAGEGSIGSGSNGAPRAARSCP